MSATSTRIGHLVASARLSDVCAALGKPVRCGRIVADWRGGKRLSVAINDRTGKFIDYGSDGSTPRCGDALDLIQIAVGCDLRAAIAWLQDFTGVRLGTETPEQAKQRRRVAAQAAALAEEAAWWAHGLRLVVERQYRDLLSILELFGESDVLNADTQRQFDAIQERQARMLYVLSGSEPDRLMRWFLAARRRDPQGTRVLVGFGREDLAEADRIGRIIVRWLVTNAPERLAA